MMVFAGFDIKKLYVSRLLGLQGSKILRQLFESVLDPFCSANTQWSSKLLHGLLIMKAPELPGAIFSNKTPDNGIPPWMLVDEVGTVIDDIVHDNPRTTLALREA